MQKHPSQPRGFTLIELMTSVSVFLIVMTISMGSIIGIFDANEKVGSLKTVMDNLNFSLESMSREIRFGSRYHCGPFSAPYAPLNCTGGNGSTRLTFLSNDGTEQIGYFLSGSSIMKTVDGSVANAVPVTAPEVNIQSLTFYVTGAPLDSFQPRVVIKIKGRAGSKPNTQSEFTIQTTASQRKLDNGL